MEDGVTTKVLEVLADVSEVMTGVLETKSGVPEVITGVLKVTTRVLELTSGVLEVIMGILEATTGVPEATAGVDVGVSAALLVDGASDPLCKRELVCEGDNPMVDVPVSTSELERSEVVSGESRKGDVSIALMEVVLSTRVLVTCTSILVVSKGILAIFPVPVTST